MLKAQKIEFVQNLSEELKKASAIVLVDYMGLDVAKQMELKRSLKSIGANMFVVKNSLFKLAGEKINAPKELLEDSILSGPTALIIAKEDPIAPLQVIEKFARENELPQMKVGLVEGGFQDKSALIALSKLPGKDALVAQVLGSISAPLYGIVGVLNTPMQKLMYILNESKKAREHEGKKS